MDSTIAFVAAVVGTATGVVALLLAIFMRGKVDAMAGQLSSAARRVSHLESQASDSRAELVNASSDDALADAQRLNDRIAELVGLHDALLGNLRDLGDRLEELNKLEGRLAEDSSESASGNPIARLRMRSNRTR